MEKTDEITRLIEKEKVSEPQKVTEIKTQEIKDTFENDTMKPMILKEISDFSPYCESITLSTLFAISHWKSVINISPRGQGKSRSTKELLDFLRVPYKEINGRITAKSLFEELKNDGIIVIDEAAQILSDKEVQSILLSALTGQEIRWQTTRTSMKHTFKGIIICNANQFSNSNEIRAAVLDRCLVNRISLNKEHILEKIKSERTYTPNLETWRVMIERLNLTSLCKAFPDIFALDPLNDNGQVVRSGGQAKVSKSNLFKTLLSKNSEKRTDLQKTIDDYLLEKLDGITSMRPWERIQFVADFSYNLLGDFSIVDTLIDSIKNTDRVQEISKMEIPRADKVKMIAELKGYSDVRSARRLLKKIEDSIK
jgi:hypothetical protein